MIERTTLADGLEVSRILTGLWQIADLERSGDLVDRDATAAAMHAYVEAGFTTFDMADHYGSAEDIAGAYRERVGDAAECLTKWVPRPGPYTRDEVRAAVQVSLDRLNTDSIDLLQFHAWRYSDPVWLDCLFWLDELREEGLIRHLGLTNFDASHLAMVLETGVRVVSNQVSYSLLDRRAGEAMAQVCEKYGVGLLAFGTVAGGFLTERWLGRPDPAAKGIDRLETWSLMKYRRFIEVAGGWDRFQSLLDVVSKVSRKHGVSMANVACRYVLDQPAVAGVIVGARLGRSEHIEDNARVFALSLDREDRAALDEGAAALDPIPGDTGDEYRRPPYLTAAGDLSDHVEGFSSPYETVDGPPGRRHALSGTVWEDLAGFSRAVRTGDRILVSGTTATHRDRLIGGGDPGAQMNFVIDKVEGAIESLGGRLEDVVRTRVFIHREEDWEAVSRAHGRRFDGVRPANTLVRAGLIGEGYLVEMEAEALVGGG
ncbi:MAG: aldo/keto reductase [Gemmatimonadota bacterium]|nr:aldo/keto reductase [Gemmatimonadota bacterium]